MTFIPEPIRRASERSDELSTQLSQGQMPQQPNQAPTQVPQQQVQSFAPQQNFPQNQPPNETAQQMAFLQDQLAQLQRQNQQLMAQIQSQPKPQPKPNPLENYDFSTLIPQEKREMLNNELGEDSSNFFINDFPKAIAKVFQDQQKQQFDTFQQEFNQTFEPVKQQVAKTGEEKFFQSLGTSVTNWKEINSDMTFRKWLLKPCPFDVRNRTYDEVLQEAHAAHNPNPAIEVFRAYQAQSGQQQNPMVQQEQPMPFPQPQMPPYPMPQQQQVSPEAWQWANKQMWTQNDIKQFYDLARRGQFAEHEKQMIEANMLKAVSHRNPNQPVNRFV